MKKIPARYFAMVSGIICVICICLMLFTDVATVFVPYTEKSYSLTELIFSSDFDQYPYSKVDLYWRIIPLTVSVLAAGSLICSVFYKRKIVMAVGCILSLIAFLATILYNHGLFYGTVTSECVFAFSDVMYASMIVLYTPFMTCAYTRCVKENDTE